MKIGADVDHDIGIEGLPFTGGQRTFLFTVVDDSKTETKMRKQETENENKRNAGQPPAPGHVVSTRRPAAGPWRGRREVVGLHPARPR